MLGWRFHLYLVEPEENEMLRIVGPPGKEFFADKQFSRQEKKLLELLEASSDKALMKKYSKDKTVVDFMKNLSEEKIETYLRPAIEIYSSKMIPLIREAGIPMYIREEMKRNILHPEQRIFISENTTHCVFHFVKDESGLRYFISLLQQEAELSLLNKPEVILVNKPAIVVSDNQLHIVEGIEAKRLKPFFTKSHIAVPPAMEQKYMRDFVLRTFLQYPTKMHGISVNRSKPEKEAILFLEEDFNHRLCLRLYFAYGTNLVNPASKKMTTAWIDEQDIFRIHCFERDEKWERSKLDTLLSLGLRLEGDQSFYLKEQGSECALGLIEWINSHQSVWLDFELRQKVDKVYYTKDIKLRTSYSEETDWFDIRIEVVVDGFVLPFYKFRKHILTSSREYMLPDNSVLVLPSEWFERYGELFLYGENVVKNIRLKKHHFSLVGKLFQEEEETTVAEWRMPATDALSFPDTPNYCLRPYQRTGIQWLLYLHANHFGGCLADDMGLGKTLQTIVLLQYLYKQSPREKKKPLSKKKKPIVEQRQLSLFEDMEPANPKRETTNESELPPSLVVMPTSLLHNWKNEIEKFAPELKVYVYAGNHRLKTKNIDRIFKHYHIVISSYGTVRNDMEYLNNSSFYYLILDESQYVKNVDSQTYKAVKQLHSSHRLVLTGTPIENSLTDLWAQFNFINEGLLGSFSSFQKAYVQPIIKNENKEVEARLKRLIRPFLLRRTKEEVTPELPPVTLKIVYCDMSDQQKAAYVKEKNQLRNHFLGAEKEFQKNKLIVLQGLMRLRLLANHPSLALPDYTGDSGKFEQIISSFETLLASGHKVLIFSSFVKHLKVIAEEFDRREWNYSFLSGQTKDREAAIARFTNRPEVNCFLISLKAGGVGLNLTAADYVFIVDPWWNPAAEMQALSRAHRIGQDKNVMVYRFISTDTIEEKIVKLQEKKAKLSSTFITSGNMLEHLTAEELKSLFSITS